MIHWLKTDPVYFEDLWYDNKSYEVRNNDRQFEVGDLLILAEGTDTAKAQRAIIVRVTSIIGDNFPGLKTDYVGLGLKIIGRFSEDEMTLFEHSLRKVTSEQWTSYVKAKDLKSATGESS